MEEVKTILKYLFSKDVVSFLLNRTFSHLRKFSSTVSVNIVFVAPVPLCSSGTCTIHMLSFIFLSFISVNFCHYS